MKRPAFWIGLTVISLACTFVGIRYFPQAFSIVALNITMDRERALEEARAIMSRDALGPAGFRQAASFSGDDEAQTFVELEGGGKEAFTRMLREEYYAAYTWRVRHFKESETHETTIRFTPEGRPYGFVERLSEDEAGPAIDPAAARKLAEETARTRWNLDLSPFTLVEQGQERRPGGRVDHALTYERASPTLNEGRYRVRLVVSGDRLTEITPFIKIPEAFTRRYAAMRAANEAIGIGSVVGMALLYVFGGIGAGLFFMMRRRYVLWRHAAFWGIAVGLLQTLASLNEFPLLWMTYDTALPRSTFLAQQIATLVAGFLGFSAFFALSFMAAETLTRRAFGHHPQFWRVWAGPDRAPGGARTMDGPGASTEVLGRTAAGYLLVSVFFAYDVVLYLVMTKAFGWWSPADALVHPDVLATYAPWLSAIANSFQAGFWEESLFRAVPLAGAALIGDRFGRRRLFLVIGFIVQAIVFGSGHAPYPNQPAFARPVELIIPSVGFGLLYLYYGLLPGIILHFTFDVIWFALPVFMANAPGIRFQQLMIVLLTFVPLWIVFWRRAQAGRWTRLSPDDYNAAWIPPPLDERLESARVQPHDRLGARARTVWLALGAAGLVGCAAAIVLQRPAAKGPFGSLQVSRGAAADIARRAIEGSATDAMGGGSAAPSSVSSPGTLGPKWRVMPVPDSGSGGPHEFVAKTAGEERWRALVGVYLPKPRWRVRAATFEGDVEARAEEWQVYVGSGGEVRNVQHTLPEGRAGAALDEPAARRLATAAVGRRLGLDAARGQIREVSASPSKLRGRTDWTFTFVDTTIAPLPKGEPRVNVEIAGDEVAALTRYIHVPEEWARQQRAGATRNLVLQILERVVQAGLLLSAAIAGIIAWSRRRYAPRLFAAGAAIMFVVSAAKAANNWPAVVASFNTAAPLALQELGVVGLGLVGLTLVSLVAGLALGALPHYLAAGATLPDRDAMRLGLCGGLVAAAASIAAAALRTPEWARAPDIEPYGTAVPILQAVIDPITRVLLATAVIVVMLLVIDRVTSGWTRRRALGAAALATLGFLGAGVPAGGGVAGWLVGAFILAAALAVTYVTLLRFDLTMVPVAVAAMTAVSALVEGFERAYPGALAGSFGAAALIMYTGWWWFRALRRARSAAVVQMNAAVAAS